MSNPQDQAKGPATAKNPAGDRVKARDLLEKVPDGVLSRDQRKRLQDADKAIEKVARRSSNGALFLDTDALHGFMSTLVDKPTATRLLARMQPHLGDRVRKDPHASPVSWDDFCREAGLGETESSLFDVAPQLAHAKTPSEFRAKLGTKLAQVNDPKADAAAKAYVHSITVAAADEESINVPAVDVCIEQRLASSWWALALIVVGCMICTFPLWWLGLIFAGIVVGGWLITICLICLTTVG
jgi:hypothetical protein